MATTGVMRCIVARIEQSEIREPGASTYRSFPGFAALNPWHGDAALQPAAKRRQAAVGARLIEDREARGGLDEHRGVGRLFHLESVEARAQQELKLVAQHFAGGAQLAAKSIALAQQARLAVGAAIA